ncbi:MAG: glycosyltransferase family 2 protein [Gammaproteobacteria bacterium]|nr:glycosyltransferase family 2 protein [Gammaproteobacteria bacterium]
MIEHITAVIITKNAQTTLAACLESLRPFAEVVIFDNGSNDDTLIIARSYPNVKVYQGIFQGFGPTKNHAVSLANNSWVFCIDADERITPALADELTQWPLDTPDNHVAKILRENWFMGKPVRVGGWGNDRLIRLFHRVRYGFDDAPVHEKVWLNSPAVVRTFEGVLQHAAVDELGQFLIKINRYSEIRRQTSKRSYRPFIIVLRSLAAFLKSYVLKLGFLAGWRGLVIAVADANGVFFKYMKIYVYQQQPSSEKRR